MYGKKKKMAHGGKKKMAHGGKKKMMAHGGKKKSMYMKGGQAKLDLATTSKCWETRERRRLWAV